MPPAEEAALRVRSGAPDAVREARAFIASGETSQTATNNAAKTAYKIVNAVRGSKSISDADRAALAGVLKDLGQAVYTGRNYPAASQVYTAADQLCGRGNARDGKFQGNVASCCSMMGDFDGCLNACRESLTVMSDGRGGYVEDGPYVAKVLRRLCKALLKTRRTNEAKESYVAARVLDFEGKLGEELIGLMKKEGLVVESLDALAWRKRAGSGSAADTAGPDEDSDGGMPNLESSSSEEESEVPSVGKREARESEDDLMDANDDLDEDAEDSDSGPVLGAADDSDEGSMPGLVDEDDDGDDESSEDDASSDDSGDAAAASHSGPSPNVSAPAGFRSGFLNKPASTRPPSENATASFKNASGAQQKSAIVVGTSESASGGDNSDEDSDEPPSLACSDSDSEEDMADDLPSMDGEPSSDDDAPKKAPPPRPQSSVRRPPSSTRPQNGQSSAPPEVVDYDSADSSYSDEEKTLKVSTLTMKGGDWSRLDHCKDVLRKCISAIMGKQFITASRTPDFDAFFTHVAAPGMKTKKKGGKGKKPHLCITSCPNCWARKMWRVRFPWNPSDRSTANGSSSSASGGSDPVPRGMSAADRLLFNQVGGFGSGRELHVSDISACVHGLAYFSILQIELSWKEAVLVPRAKDAQFAFRSILAAVYKDPNAGFLLSNQFQELLHSICSMFRENACDLSKARWDMGRRSSSVAKEVCETRENQDGFGRVALLGSIRSELPVALPQSDFGIYLNSSAWERVGRLEKEEEMVLRSFARDITGFVAEYKISGESGRGFYYERWKESMREAASGNTRSGPSMLRILRRSLYERSKYIELEVGDIPLRTGIVRVDAVLAAGKPLSQSAMKLMSLCEEKLVEAKRWVSSTSSKVLPDGELVSEAEARVHRRAVSLISECIKRVGQSPRLFYKRGKRYLNLGMLREASNDAEQGKKVLMKLLVDNGDGISANFPWLGGEFQRLEVAIAIKRLEVISTPERQLELCEKQLENLRVLKYKDAKAGEKSDLKFLAASAKNDALVDHLEPIRREAALKLDMAKSRSASFTAAADSDGVYEPKPANLPSASAAASVPSAAEKALARERKVKATAEKSVGMSCCYDDCDRETREILRKEPWAETVCVTGCVAVCHKKCYRNFKNVRGELCPSCGKQHIFGKALFMMFENQDKMRAKRAPVPRSEKQRPVNVGDVVEKEAAVDEIEKSVPSPPAGSSSGATATNSGASSAGPSKISKVAAGKSTAINASKTNCEICEKSFNSNAQYLVHAESKKHESRVDKLKKNTMEDKKAKEAARQGAVFFQSHSNPGSQRQTHWDGSYPNQNSFSSFPSPGAPADAPIRIPTFRLNDAVDVVVAAIRRATAVSGLDYVMLQELQGSLDMSAWGVANAEAYFVVHWQGLKTFLKKQQLVFAVSSFNFRQPNPKVSLRADVEAEDRSAAAESWNLVSAPEEAPLPDAFPTLDESNTAALVGGMDVYQRMQQPFLGPSTDVRSLPRPFQFDQSAAMFEVPKGYVDLPKTELEAGEEECGICVDNKATHAIGPCPCDALFCERCLVDWLNRQKGNVHNCIGCGALGQFTEYWKAGTR